MERPQPGLVRRWLRPALFACAAACVAGVIVSAVASAAPAGGASIAAEGAAGKEISLFEAFFVQRNHRTERIEWLGSMIIWLLLLMSVATFALVGVFSRENTRERIVPSNLVAMARKRLADGEPQRIVPSLEEDRSDYARLLRASLRESDAGHKAMLRSLEQACDELTAMRMRRVESLNIIGSVSPMIGLFGTVYGMILAFREIVAAGGAPDPVGLAAGIGTALTTTFWGLVVAIPALAAYALLRNTIDALSSEASLAAEDGVNHFRPPPSVRVSARRPG